MYAVGGAPAAPESVSTTSTARENAVATAALMGVLNPITGWGTEVHSPPRPQGRALEPPVDAFGPTAAWLDTDATAREDGRAGTRTDLQRGRSGMVTPTEHKDSSLEVAVLELRTIEPGPGVPQDREPWRTVPTSARARDAELLAADHSLFLSTPVSAAPRAAAVKRGAQAAEDKWQAMVKWEKEKYDRREKQKAAEDAKKVEAEETLVQKSRKHIQPQRQGDLYTRLATTDRRGKPLKRGSTATRTTPYERSMRRGNDSSAGTCTARRKRDASTTKAKRGAASPTTSKDRPGSPAGTTRTPSVVARLCDTREYTGAHKMRFDAFGKGRGIRGRRDSIAPVHDMAAYTRRGPLTPEQGQLAAADAVVEEGDPPSPVSRLKHKFRGLSYSAMGQDPKVLLRSFDQDRSGKIDLQEFISAARRGAGMTREQMPDLELWQLFQNVDSDASGSISIDELVTFIWGRQAPVSASVSRADASKNKQLPRREQPDATCLNQSEQPIDSCSLPVFQMDTVVQELKARQQQTQLAVVVDDEQEEGLDGGQLTYRFPDQALDELQSEAAEQFDNLLAAVTSIPDAASGTVEIEKGQESATDDKLDNLLATVSSIPNAPLETVVETSLEQERELEVKLDDRQEQELQPEPEPQSEPTQRVRTSSEDSSHAEIQRKHVALEFLSTEKTYQDGLRCLKVEWMDQLRFKSSQAAKSSSGQTDQSGQAYKQKRTSMRRMSRGAGGINASAAAAATAAMGFPDTQDVDKLFGNVESLLVLSEQLLSMLQDRIGENPPGSQWTPMQKIGDIFVTLGPYFTSSYKEYVANFDNANAHIVTMQATYPLFATTLDQLREVQGGLDLASYMVMPVQRLPRYRMLLEELIRKTSPDHNDYTDLTAALKIIKDVTTAVNEAAREDRSSEAEAEVLRRELAKLQLRNSCSHDETQRITAGHNGPADSSQFTLLQKEKEDAETQRRMAEQMNAKLAQALAAKDAELKAFRDSAAPATAATDMVATDLRTIGQDLDALYAEHQVPIEK